MILKIEYKHRITRNNLLYAILFLEHDDQDPNKDKIIETIKYALEIKGRYGCLIDDNINLIMDTLLENKEKYDKVMEWYKKYEYLVEEL